MSSPHVEGIQPRLVEFGSTVGENEGGGGGEEDRQLLNKPEPRCESLVQRSANESPG